MATRIRELSWNCTSCSAQGILGRHKQCPTCGSPREKGEMKMTGSGKGAVVTDPSLLQLAKAGADWFCTHCDSGNIGTGNRCSNCGSPRYGEKAENHPDPRFGSDHIGKAASTGYGALNELVEKGAQTTRAEKEQKQEGEKWFCPWCQNLNPESRSRCGHCDSPRHLYGAGDSRREGEEGAKKREEDLRRRREEESRWREEGLKREQRERDLKFYLLVAGGVILMSGIVTFGYWASQKHQVVGKITSQSWTQWVRVSTWSQTTARLWQHQTVERPEVPPTGGRGEVAGFELMPGTCSDEHFADEDYICGSHEECEDKYRTESETYSCSRSESYVCGEDCRDNGNGFETCSDRTCTRDVPDTCTRSVSVFDHKDCHTVDDHCSRPIMKPKCTYKTQVWVTTATPTFSGTGVENMKWPEPELTALQTSSSGGTYTIAATYEDRGNSEKLEKELSLSEYMTWRVGQPVYLQVNNLGGVSSYSAEPENKPGE